MSLPIPVETTEIEVEAHALTERAAALEVTDAATHADAAEELQAIKRYTKAVDTLLAEPIADAHKLHKTLTGKRSLLKAPAEKATRVIKDKMRTWKLAEDARIAAEQRKAREAAEAEARRVAEEKRLAQALEAEEIGEPEKAEEILAELDAPVYVPPPPTPPPAVPKNDKVSYRKVWRAECIDRDALIAAIAAGWAPASFVTINQAELDRFAREGKDGVSIPGVRVWCDETVVAR